MLFLFWTFLNVVFLLNAFSMGRQLLILPSPLEERYAGISSVWWKPHKRHFWPLNRLPFHIVLLRPGSVILTALSLSLCVVTGSRHLPHITDARTFFRWWRWKRPDWTRRYRAVWQLTSRVLIWKRCTAWSRCLFGASDVFESKVFALILR